MGLRPQSIGSVMSFGFAGSYSRQPDMVVTTAPLEGSVDILFGTPLVRGSDGAVRSMGSGSTGAQFVGVAGREVKSATGYLAQSTGRYAPNDPVSVFQRGTICVHCQKGVPAMDGPVYVRVVKSGGYEVGGFEAEADGENSVVLPNAMWNGPKDGNGVAELRIAYVGPIPAGPTYTLPAATPEALGGVKQAPAIPDIGAAPTQQDFNGLLAALRTAGILASN
ncbi:head fiber protein [Clostridium sp. J1101437_171009_A5]|uniref:structural cement protein Gp24 n=1 Tax=Clostridium sp. J1101437_171009_A5 TaxID=2787098 RepID=UPI00189994E4|nr:head fiber protein [Clostridium sp. J1101437_171009_A5]